VSDAFALEPSSAATKNASHVSRQDGDGPEGGATKATGAGAGAGELAGVFSEERVEEQQAQGDIASSSPSLIVASSGPPGGPFGDDGYSDRDREFLSSSVTLRLAPSPELSGALAQGRANHREREAMGVAAWLHMHLLELAQEVGQVQLGIVCARIGIAFADVASPHLPLAERIRRLLAHLTQRRGPGLDEGLEDSDGRAHEPRGLWALASALLADEGTASAASARGLPAVLSASEGAEDLPGSSAASPTPGATHLGLGMGAPRICQPLPPPPAWLGRDAELYALDAHLRTGARIVFLRGESGAGKSALLGRWLRELLVANSTAWQEAGFDGLFYWSFTHDPDVYSFLRAAADYVCGGSHRLSDLGLGLGAGPGPGMLGGPPAAGEQTACRYYLDRLQSGLARRTGPLLLVLDGLERLQDHGGRPRSAAQGHSLVATPPTSGEAAISLDEEETAPQPPTEGEIVEPHLASLLLSLTLGLCRGSVVATIAAPIPSLQPWLGSRCVEVELPPLAPFEGAALLRYSGVTSGADSDVEQRSIEHGGHALTLHLLGRYLHAYFEGDGRAVTRSELPALDTGLYGGDPYELLGRTSLRQLLRAHLLALPDPARRLLDLCVLLPGQRPGPLRISALQALLEQIQRGGVRPFAQSPGAASGAALPALASFRAPTPPVVLLPDPMWLQGASGLVEKLAELEKLGLLHIVTLADGEEGIEIHPLLREPIYREWLAARGGFFIVPHQEQYGVQGYLPRGEQALELLENLVGLLLAAGQPELAYGVLAERLGGYLHHVHYLGRAWRFLLIVRQIYPAVAGVAVSDEIWQRRYARLLAWEAETLRVLGQLEAALVTAQRQWPLGSPPLPGRLCQQARVLRSMGRLDQAAALATAARHTASSSFDSVVAAIELGIILLLQGDPAMCQVHLLDAMALLRDEREPPLSGLEALDLHMWIERAWAQRALYLGHYERARMLLAACRRSADERHSELDGAQCDVLLAELLRRTHNYEMAGQTLHRVLAASRRSGDIETLIHGSLLQGRMRMDTGHFDGAMASLGPALDLSVEHGFGSFRIELLLARGALQLRRGELDAAEQDARDALAYATAPGCGYLWGEADALHLLATVLIAGRPAVSSPRHAEAVAHLSDELELREKMSDPSAPEVRWLLRRLRP
jgi:hypothetical protein